MIQMTCVDIKPYPAKCHENQSSCNHRVKCRKAHYRGVGKKKGVSERQSRLNVAVLLQLRWVQPPEVGEVKTNTCILDSKSWRWKFVALSCLIWTNTLFFIFSHEGAHRLNIKQTVWVLKSMWDKRFYPEVEISTFFFPFNTQVQTVHISPPQQADGWEDNVHNGLNWHWQKENMINDSELINKWVCNTTN